MSRRSLGIAIASIVVLGGCSSTAEETQDTVESAAGEASEGAVDALEPTEEPGAEEPAAEEPAPDDEGEATTGTETTVLLGSVGTEEDPEAFVITLTTEDGEEVTDLPAGDYSIQVDDPSTIHNFHLTGGDVDESTSVPETEQVTFDVTLEPGEYTFKCDPHPSMTGTFTVS